MFMFRPRGYDICELVSVLPLLFRETVAEDTNSYLFPGRIC